jgi:hypothetical protein
MNDDQAVSLPCWGKLLTQNVSHTVHGSHVLGEEPDLEERRMQEFDLRIQEQQDTIDELRSEMNYLRSELIRLNSLVASLKRD